MLFCKRGLLIELQNGIVMMIIHLSSQPLLKEKKLYWRRNVPLEMKNSLLIEGKKRLRRGWIEAVLKYDVLLSVTLFSLNCPCFFLLFHASFHLSEQNLIFHVCGFMLLLLFLAEQKGEKKTLLTLSNFE